MFASRVFSAGPTPPKLTRAQVLQSIIDATQPLKFPRGDRLPILAWPAQDVPLDDAAAAEAFLGKLGDRGIGAFASWNYGDKDKSLAAGLKIARLQKKLGLPVAISAVGVMSGFYNGDKSTAHVDADGKPFFDKSQTFVQLGCPFAVEGRYPAVQKQIDFFAKGYKDAGVDVDFVFADWEFDGPLEWGEAWELSKKCVHCREHIKDLDTSFPAFQKAVRTVRADMQKKVYADLLRGYFPKILVGNYGVYPNDGFRYWYDFFEKVPPPPAIELKADHHAKFRPWFQEFPLTGYTYAMPVVFPRYRTFEYYDDSNTDYRWFHGLMQNASNVGKSTPGDVPIVSWVRWGVTDAPKTPDANFKPMSEKTYQELLWHMLLRGHDGMFIFCNDAEAPKELRLLQEVYAASLQYKAFLDKGTPVTFAIPESAGPVVSGLKLGDRLLVRRTDFTDDDKPVMLTVGDQRVSIKRADGISQVIQLEH
ncbi:MAG TPA: hypothetical protein VG326_04360 [Tepidisphaeraceae bacterium]|nr:hypothetical protein [Tepidisphaeraceae bacterium]